MMHEILYVIIFIEKIEKIKKNRKNRKITEKIVQYKLDLLERMSFSTNHIISDVEDELLKIYIDTFRMYENEIDKVHLTYSKIKKNHDSI